MRPYSLLLLLCFLVSFTSLQAQDSIINAFKAQIKTATVDSVKVRLLLKLSDEVYRSNIDLGCNTILDAKKIADAAPYKNFRFQKLKVEILQSLANCGIVRGDLVEALKYQQQTIDFCLEIKDTIGLGKAYRGRGIIYQRKDDTLHAEKYFRKAIALQEIKGNPKDLAYSYTKLGHIYNSYRKLDSARYFFTQAKTVNPSTLGIVRANANIGTSYIYENKHEKAIEIQKENLKIIDPKNHLNISSIYNNLASSYSALQEYDEGLEAIDSAIFYSKKQNDKSRLVDNYRWKYYMSAQSKRFEDAFLAHQKYKIYSDSLNNIEEVKRFTELELNYEFEKEKEVTALALESESSKKRIYFILLFVVFLLALVFIYFIIKGKKQKIALAKKEVALTEMEKIKSDLALANRENELKKVVIENSITEEVLNKTLDDIKEIIMYQDEKERKVALRSLSASLLSEKTTQKDTIGLQSYVDEVAMEFKILLDQKFPEFNSKEKELLYLIKLGLTTNEMTKVLNTTLSSVKSKRYRIRKKLDIDPSTDIIAHIEQYA